MAVGPREVGKWPRAIVCDLFLHYLFCPQDKDLKQYLDDCGNVINMHNVKVGVGQKAKSRRGPHSPTHCTILPETTFAHPVFLLGAIGGYWEPVICVIRHWAQYLFGREHCLPAAREFDDSKYLLTSASHSWVSSCSCSSCSVAWPTATGRRCYTETSSPRTYSSTRGESSNWQTLVPPASPFFLLSPQHYSPSSQFPMSTVSFHLSLCRL